MIIMGSKSLARRRKMKSAANTILALVAVSAVFLVMPGSILAAQEPEFTDSFMIGDCGGFSSRGSNPYFILEPGFQLILEGEEDGEELRLIITVLHETKKINGVETRVVEEMETLDGELVEISRNYFAICNRTNSVFYFGEDVDIYENGKVVSHEGAWRAGSNGARPGIMMPGTILLGGRYYQEIAPGVALDRAEIISMSQVIKTPAGTFKKCLKTEETTPLEPNARGFKFYAPGIGLIIDGPAKLTGYHGGYHGGDHDGDGRD
jgi:hypothetical protein